MDAGTININTGKSLLQKVQQSGKSPAALVAEEGLGLVSDDSAIRTVCQEVLAESPDVVVVATGGFGLDWTVGLQRLGRLENTHYWVGLVKTPVFATVIALIGCQAGMSVRGSALEVGRATTSSVVQAIFWVIVLDAIFSIAFRRLGL